LLRMFWDIWRCPSCCCADRAAASPMRPHRVVPVAQQGKPSVSGSDAFDATDAADGATESLELELGTGRHHGHHHHDGHDRDRRCHIDECGFVKRCKDIYVGRICWEIFCYCESEEAEISVDDDEGLAVTADEGPLEKDRRCGEDDCGWIRWCRHHYCANVYCHCRHRLGGKEEAAEEQGELPVELEAVQAARNRDDRCAKDDCGWVQQCTDTPAGPKCWDIFCYCPDTSETLVAAQAGDVQPQSVRAGTGRERDERCLPEDCGWVQDCVETPAGPPVCWDLFCYCRENADGLGDKVDATEDLAGVHCRKHDCGPVEHCVMEHSGVEVCWTIHCTRGCDDMATAVDHAALMPAA